MLSLPLPSSAKGGLALSVTSTGKVRTEREREDAEMQTFKMFFRSKYRARKWHSGRELV